MPAIALTPLAWTALRLGTLAAVAVYASRRNASRARNSRLLTVPTGAASTAAIC